MVIDIANPASPTLRGRYESTYPVMDVAVSGNYAYVAVFPNWNGTGSVGGGGLQVIDIRDKANPALVGGIITGIPAHGIALSGDYAYVAANDAGLEVFDVSDPTHPARAGGYDVGFAMDVQVAGSYVYAAGDFGVQVIDVSVPSNPKRIGGSTKFSATSVTVHGDKVFVAAGAEGLIILNKFTNLRFGPASLQSTGGIHFY
jgi:hypothetical protein